MATTYEAIATVTVGSGGAANIEFTSIPATYTDLLLKLSVRSDYAAVFSRNKLQINAITTGYDSRLVYGQDTTVSSATSTDYITYFYSTGSSATASTFSNTEIYIPNYAGSNNKSTSSDSVAESNTAATFLSLAAGLLSNTAVISSLKITDANGGNLVQHSSATLYGIKNS
jgi:hypothetical protein